MMAGVAPLGPGEDAASPQRAISPSPRGAGSLPRLAFPGRRQMRSQQGPPRPFLPATLASAGLCSPTPAGA